MAADLAEDPSAAALDLDNSEAYDSAEDEDFQLDAGDNDEEAGDDSGFSTSEDENEAGDSRPNKKRKLDKISLKRKRKGGRDTAEVDRMELDSGDEVTIQKAKSKRKKVTSGKDAEEEEEEDILFDDDDEGGEGGFVKTRSMRMKIQEDRKPLANIDGATIDVNTLWAKMNAPDSDSGLLPTSKPATTENETQEPSSDQNKENITEASEKIPSEDLIKIKRTYKFAGQIHTEEKLVARDSAEAKLYLAETANGEKGTPDTESQSDSTTRKLRRPLRKVSRFDPNPSGVIKKSWEKQAISIAGEQDAKGPKLNTVEKSRLDWAQYVDVSGIKDELNVHSKAKEGFLGRMDFLDRVDAKREEERRNIRLQGL
ncbi:bucentaur or craniofacial development-domain-containing protein [Talaromyces proteolyticus]|uniref:SWR1-complex protein 5 n=1 Tax=Talaromyces proteolyticus TaxID=1131652 RepID=A0AAD4KTU7_9EURO|nr:bucentaur or craniofacial development-domain-containing protein [Talaromyces proteolyticus]KAH8699152.1 bucentaur or craniofacial development-domain-containing protein [Talaromyces proteolyticus]